MRNNNQAVGPGDMISMRDSFDLVLFLARCYQMIFLLFLRRNMGFESIGFFGFGAMILLALVGATEPIARLYLVVWFCALIYQRVSMFRAWMRGDVVHSRYTGDPWLGWLFFKNEFAAHQGVDIAVLLLAGYLFGQSSPLFGKVIWGAIVAHFMVFAYEWQYTRLRLQRMRDAEIENQYFSDAYRR
jgi:hypothetical protein